MFSLINAGLLIVGLVTVIVFIWLYRSKQVDEVIDFLGFKITLQSDHKSHLKVEFDKTK